jgi:hypothetical protein
MRNGIRLELQYLVRQIPIGRPQRIKVRFTAKLTSVAMTSRHRIDGGALAISS